MFLAILNGKNNLFLNILRNNFTKRKLQLQQYRTLIISVAVPQEVIKKMFDYFTQNKSLDNFIIDGKTIDPCEYDIFTVSARSEKEAWEKICVLLFEHNWTANDSTSQTVVLKGK